MAKERVQGFSPERQQKPPNRQRILSAPGYDHITTIRKALTAIEDELAGDCIDVVIGAKCEEITEALAQIWTRDMPRAELVICRTCGFAGDVNSAEYMGHQCGWIADD